MVLVKVASPQEQVIAIGDLIFSALFALDVTVRLLVLGPRFFKVCMNYAPWHDLLEHDKHLLNPLCLLLLALDPDDPE